jgi:hypothetical protein
LLTLHLFFSLLLLQPGFGYTRLDAILVSVGLPLVGFALHAGLMSTGMVRCGRGARRSAFTYRPTV